MIVGSIRGHRLLAALALAGTALIGPLATPAAAGPGQPITAENCKRAPGVAHPTSTWAGRRLGLAKVSSITRGATVGTGAPVRVAVLDSGLDSTHPQLRGVDSTPELDAIGNDPGRAFSDCFGHGTQVTAIIAAQPDPANPGFVGVAPDARIVPVKLTNTDAVAAADVARAIDLAVAAKAKVANLSLSLSTDSPDVRAAVSRAQRAGMLIVAAAGNKGGAANKFAQYPAAYSARFDNVVAVAASTAEDTIADFSGPGAYIDVAAPGEGVQTIGVNGGYLVEQGTSFAAPYVAGVAALVLAAHPTMSPAQVRARLRATADPPPATVPSTSWGYGTVDPYLAVTSVSVDPLTPARSVARPGPLPAQVASAPADRTLQHVALGVGLGLLALAALAVVAGTVLSRSRRGSRGLAVPGG